ncbi:RNA-binding S4 domain-containing protein [Vibrio porteresiae]|uniref:RNA-binding S4 domain-containing protein n=1 Tax=Vibrio porteresiae DSM 19223 TaxID=1123496 RepID=A0ABZ0QH88_9VIBR|nr:RNA-binding S4 domain-containing protein [Vibrio porteresiae]WPC75805.1 RNA-binding S4 domain-containing protein [Vibrio porteresiae DSM 19223]
MTDMDQQEFVADDEIEIEAVGVEVSEQPIELYKVLKIADAISGGGEAKHVITEGYVFVNGELETRKRRKMYDGDLIEFNEEFYLVICDAPVSEPKEKPVAKPAPKKNRSSGANKASASKKASNTPDKAHKGPKSTGAAKADKAEKAHRAATGTKKSATKANKSRLSASAEKAPVKESAKEADQAPTNTNRTGRNSIDFL